MNKTLDENTSYTPENLIFDDVCTYIFDNEFLLITYNGITSFINFVWTDKLSTINGKLYFVIAKAIFARYIVSRDASAKMLKNNILLPYNEAFHYKKIYKNKPPIKGKSLFYQRIYGAIIVEDSYILRIYNNIIFIDVRTTNNTIKYSEHVSTNISIDRLTESLKQGILRNAPDAPNVDNVADKVASIIVLRSLT